MSINRVDFAFLQDLLRRESAMVLEPGKEYFAETRLLGMAARENLPNVEALVARVRVNVEPALRRRLIESMTINETSFFRDVHPFDALKTDILPRIVAARAAETRLNIWCCASSSGQEPYSVAMVIKDHFPQVRNWRVRIVATDLSTEILARARSGVYSQLEMNRGLPAPLLVKHFTRIGDEWKINDGLRQMVEFQPLNLAAPWPNWGPFDVIFLRNVMIYFDTATKRAILERARKQLRPDGALFLGSAESTYGIDESFERVSLGKAQCYRPGATATATAIRSVG